MIAVLLKTLQVQQSSLPQTKIQQSGDRSYVFVVADGMGGRAGGEEASALAIGTVESFILGTFKWFAQFQGADHDRVLNDFRRALAQAHARVLAEGAEHAELRGMGTTLTLAYSLNDVLFVAHVGDSRCYLRRNGELFRLTHDHTYVEEMVRRGELTAEEATRHRLRHIITNTVGCDPKDVKVEVHKLSLDNGDRLLLCSDGLTEMLADKAINEALAAEVEPQQACRRLVDGANAAGGRDNITVIVADYRMLDQEPGVA
ncbi:MAG TPA: protein phosphatase 2C domain-containing protein [Planctomycetaceae bacterium]|nr:protein phosphatase 2C domain-containing protein [Planctomycetaceae bacterium]